MNFDFKEIDEEGLETLEAITDADKFNLWMYDSIKPFCSGKILEIGSGIGNISQFFVRDHFDITLTDLRQNYLTALSSRFPDTSQVHVDLVDEDFDTKFSHLIGTFDTVFALNVVEHIKEDEIAISNMKKLLNEGGRIIILVPAFQSLYNKIDKAIYHYRRYTKKSLNALFVKSNIIIERSWYFNAMGTLAWFIAGKLQGDTTVKKSKMSLYNAMVPIFRLIDIPCRKFLGLSVITVGVISNTKNDVRN